MQAYSYLMQAYDGCEQERYDEFLPVVMLNMGNLTIEAIASGTGFKSRTTFVNAFKRETGLKPSEYLRMAAAKER